MTNDKVNEVLDGYATRMRERGRLADRLMPEAIVAAALRGLKG